jgi:hypothetical protein
MLEDNELDSAAGAAFDIVPHWVRDIVNPVQWRRQNLTWDVQHNTTPGAATTNGCTGNKC